MSWYLEVLKKYAVFGGRARRKEYWYFALFNILAGLVLGIIDGVASLYIIEPTGDMGAGGVGLLGTIYSLAVLIPGIAVSIRRLHDTDHSGWWLLIALIPIIGVIVLLIFMCQDSQPSSNRFGNNPKEA